MATVISLTKEKLEELMAGWTGVATSQSAINTLIANMNLTLDEVQGDLTLLSGTTMPALAADLAAGSVAIDNLVDDVLPGLTLRLDSNDAAIENLETVTIPALDAQLNSNSDNIATLNDTTLPDLNTRLEAVEAGGGSTFDPTYLEDALDALTAKFPIGTVDIQDDAITADKILAHTITALEILADTITANEIAADTITANEIAAHTITAAEIFADTITANEIAADTITANEIAADTITAAEIATGTITADEIAANTITANEIEVGTITGDEIAADTITAMNLSADAITVDMLTADDLLTRSLQASEIEGVTITAGTFKTAANVGDADATVQGVIFDTAGIRAYAPDGLPFLNVDPAAGLAIVAGTGSFKSLVVADPSGVTAGGASLGGITEIQRGSNNTPGKVVLTAGTTAPKNGPTVIPVWQQDQLGVSTSGMPAWGSFRGFAKVVVDSGNATPYLPAGTYYCSVAQSTFSNQLMEIDYWKMDNTWQTRLFVTAIGGNNYVGTPHGLTVNPIANEIYILYKDNSKKMQIWRGNCAGVPIGLYEYNNADPDNDRVHSLGWDIDPVTQTIPLIILAYRKSDNHLVGHRTSATGGSETAIATDIVGSSGSLGHAGSLYGLPTGSTPVGFDTGISRAWVVTNRGDDSFRVCNSVGNEQVNYKWPAGMVTKIGFFWDGTHFRAVDQNGKIWTFTTQWDTVTANMTKWVSYSLANATLETTPSPKTVIAMPNRSGLQITAGAINSSGGGAQVPDRVKFYVGRGSTEPANTAMDKQATQLIPGLTQITYKDGLLSDGSSPYGDPKTANEFSTSGATTQSLEATNNGPFYVDGNSNGQLGTGTFRDAVIAAARPPGSIDMYAGATTPTGWLSCDGSSQLRSAYPALAAALGNPVGGGSTGPWGAADSTHFNLPDLRSRVPMGIGTFAALGATEGVAEASRTTNHTHGAGTLVNAAAADHSHGVGPINMGASDDNTGQRALGGTNTPSTAHKHNLTGTTGDNGGHNHNISGATGNVSGGATSNVPFAGIKFIIKT